MSAESATLPESCSSCIWAEMFGKIMLSPSVEINVIFEKFDSSILKKDSVNCGSVYFSLNQLSVQLPRR